jgi:hypothetical protein
MASLDVAHDPQVDNRSPSDTGAPIVIFAEGFGTTPKDFPVWIAGEEKASRLRKSLEVAFPQLAFSFRRFRRPEEIPTWLSMRRRGIDGLYGAEVQRVCRTAKDQAEFFREAPPVPDLGFRPRER